MENLKDKVIIITVASSGMGAITAHKLIKLGAKVVLAARRKDKLETLVSELGENAIFVQTDVAVRKEVDDLITQTIQKFGKIDVLWNNAGIMPVSFLEEGKVEEWDKMIDVNIKGVLYGINAVLPYMLSQGSGHIVATSSIAGKRIFKSSAVYGATKFAVAAIMDTLRDETAGKIKTTTIYPGAVETELGHDITSPKVMEMKESFENLDRLDASAIADAFIYAISQPGNIAVNDVTIRPLGSFL
ncbi:NADP-dependent 3-hydroxy acid dehydrogenase YdfG [Pedobacter cryoconitis]|uniref:SDR family oxidoreductase n=1 Tax=Pedobacter cryoconitis TaxID=188932 RepID=UPI00161491B2|nr:SDR family oxidoreductase [Pedobacter cryoconitis]MBB6273887.1 NADP-dependent 3-hydroxy acid dehydrogenase YdfG [Pedobacter cryoconitis]